MIDNFKPLALAAILLLGTAPPSPSPTPFPSPTPIPEATLSPAMENATPQQLYVQAQADAAAGRNSSALAELDRATKLDPNNMDALRLFADVEYRTEHYVEAEAAYKIVIQHDPDDRSLHNRLGGVYVAENRIDDAISQFRLSLPSEEGTADLVEVYKEEGRLPELEAEDQLDVDRAPADDPYSRFDLAYVLYAEKKYPEALALEQQVLDLRPGFWEAHNSLGMIFGEMGRYDDAINQYKMALTQNPSCYQCWMNWGVELIDTGDLKGAIDKIDKSLAVNAQFSESYMNLGVAYDNLGDFQKAIELYQEALAYDPRAPLVYFNLGWDYYEHGLFNLAEAAFIKGIAIQPRDSQLHLALGYYYQNLKQYDAAIAQYKLAMTYDPSDTRAKEQIAQVEALIGHQ
jgi:tetratricopeptide (TPR) repeat protein